MAQPYYEDHADWSLIPHHMHDCIRNYVMDGIEPGSFLAALLRNDLMEAFGRADESNARAMRGWATFLYNYVPMECRGSTSAIRAWIECGGIAGKETN